MLSSIGQHLPSRWSKPHPPSSTGAAQRSLFTQCAAVVGNPVGAADGLIEVCRRCPLLERLHLEGCDALTPAAGLAVASLSSLKYLGTHMAWLLRPNVLDATHAGLAPTAEAVSVGQRVRAALPRCLIRSGTCSDS